MMKRMTIRFFTSMLLFLLVVTPALATATEPPEGTFTAVIAFEQLRYDEVGANCLITVPGTVTFVGRLDGDATATTEALIFADCSAALTSPPGTFADIFQSTLHFTGTIDGVAVSDIVIIYQGRTAVGGDIVGQMRLDNGRLGVLYVEGEVAQGGEYWFRTP